MTINIRHSQRKGMTPGPETMTAGQEIMTNDLL